MSTHDNKSKTGLETPPLPRGKGGKGAKRVGVDPDSGYKTSLSLEEIPAGATGAEFLFLYSPKILGGECRDRDGNKIGECKLATDVVLHISWEDGQQPARLVVRHQEGRLELQEGPSWSSKGKKLGGAPADKEKGWLALPQRGERYEKRRALLNGKDVKDALRARALAMCKFDELTDPNELELRDEKTMSDDIVELTRFLLRRTLQRVSWAIHDWEFEPDLRDDEGQRDRAARVEKHVREALLQIFPVPHPPSRGAAGDRPLHLGNCEGTIASFVAGELQMSHLVEDCPAAMSMDGIPDGSNMFLFAEAALLFIRLDLHARFWRRVLPIFVCAAEFFATGYWNGTARRLDAYRPLPKHKTGVSSALILRHVEQRYRGMSAGQLAAQLSSIVGQALREDTAISVPTRRAKELQS